MTDRERFIKKVESIGYVHRVADSYVIREDDGYINVSVSPKFNDNPELYRFHKNFYQNRTNPYKKRFSKPYEEKIEIVDFKCKITSSTISFETKNLDEFLKFLMNYTYRDKLSLNKKLKKVRGIDNISSN